MVAEASPVEFEFIVKFALEAAPPGFVTCMLYLYAVLLIPPVMVSFIGIVSPA